MKLSDYVAKFLADTGVSHVFAIAGGASLHLIHSVADTDGIDFICPGHEQGAAMAAEGYARATGDIGVAITTSGPGATNLLTGVCDAFYDSIPMLVVTGQVARFRMKGDSGVRQLGFQETDICDIFEPVTKYVASVIDPTRIRYELEKAIYIAQTGRPGPVLVEIADDVQRESVTPDELQGFEPPAETGSAATGDGVLGEQISATVELLRNAERPVLILGAGIRSAGAEQAARLLVEQLDIPILLTWGVRDMFPSDSPLVVGAFGTHGTRHGNFTVQNSDLVLSIGARIDTRAAGSPHTDFARGARKVVVDIDPSEIGKFERLDLAIDVPVCQDAGIFIQGLLKALNGWRSPNIDAWKSKIDAWKQRYAVQKPDLTTETPVDPYYFVQVVSEESAEGTSFTSDTGNTLAWFMQEFRFKAGQRFHHAFNNTPMGFALPAAIGVSTSNNNQRVVCLAGDGSMHMNVQELATVIRYELPIHVFLINNGGYSMIQQTQDQWLGSEYHASSVAGGLGFPDWTQLARAYGFITHQITGNQQLRETVKEVLNTPGPVFCEVLIPSTERVIPQVAFGRPIEDSEPFLPRDEFRENMIVEPLEVSSQIP